MVSFLLNHYFFSLPQICVLRAKQQFISSNTFWLRVTFIYIFFFGFARTVVFLTGVHHIVRVFIVFFLSSSHLQNIKHNASTSHIPWANPNFTGTWRLCACVVLWLDLYALVYSISGHIITIIWYHTPQHGSLCSSYFFSSFGPFHYYFNASTFGVLISITKESTRIWCVRHRDKDCNNNNNNKRKAKKYNFYLGLTSLAVFVVVLVTLVAVLRRIWISTLLENKMK